MITSCKRSSYGNGINFKEKKERINNILCNERGITFRLVVLQVVVLKMAKTFSIIHPFIYFITRSGFLAIKVDSAGALRMKTDSDHEILLGKKGEREVDMLKSPNANHTELISSNEIIKAR
jgi:hypothetical protein